MIVNALRPSNHVTDPKLRALLAKGQDWLGRLTSGRSPSIKAIADQEHVTSSYVTRVIKLALLAPDILQRITRGEHPPELTAGRLIRMLPVPDEWEGQRKRLGFG